MPRKLATKPNNAPCHHPKLTFHTSLTASTSEYTEYMTQQLFSAATSKRKLTQAFVDFTTPANFPAPLALPGDLLHEDPKHPPQSLRSWLNLPERNQITERRGVVYVAAPPDVTQGVEFMSMSTRVRGDKRHGEIQTTSPPSADEMILYLQAFFHGVEVRRLPDQLAWTPWESKSAKIITTGTAETPRYVGLKTRKDIVRVRTRFASNNSADVTGRRIFPCQVNQLDLLDVAETVLPTDAYALLFIVNHDMYEDEDDDFCCGRAFGGSRIAVVSTARYDPSLDETQRVDRQHAWPASHCAEFVRGLCGADTKAAPLNRVFETDHPGSIRRQDQGAVSEAVKAHLRPSSKFDARTAYLFRVARTASHEIGHCFGMGHCVYYACVMQGTCSLPEDNRQPPYLCPVCEANLGHAIAKGNVASVARWQKARHEAMLKLCAELGGSFTPYAAWTRGILATLRET